VDQLVHGVLERGQAIQAGLGGQAFDLDPAPFGDRPISPAKYPRLKSNEPNPAHPCWDGRARKQTVTDVMAVRILQFRCNGKYGHKPSNSL
jgi:hypothetical protein